MIEYLLNDLKQQPRSGAYEHPLGLHGPCELLTLSGELPPVATY